MLIMTPELAKRRTLALIRIPTASPQPLILFSGKPNFAVRDRRGKNGRCRSNVLRQRPKLSGAPSWGAGRTNSLVAGSSPTSSTTHSRAPEISTFVEMPINSGPLRARVLRVRQGELVGHAHIP